VFKISGTSETESGQVRLQEFTCLMCNLRHDLCQNELPEDDKLQYLPNTQLQLPSRKIPRQPHIRQNTNIACGYTTCNY
jgi:hypothetical protein